MQGLQKPETSMRISLQAHTRAYEIYEWVLLFRGGQRANAKYSPSYVVLSAFFHTR